MISDYEAWKTRAEIIGENSISDGITLVGKNVESKYGYKGIVAAWDVAEVKMIGGAGQMNTVYSWGTLKKSGIIFDIEVVEIN